MKMTIDIDLIADSHPNLVESMVDAFNEWRIVTEEYPSVAKWERKLFRGF